MSLTDLILLLKQDLQQSFRVAASIGKRSRKTSRLRRFAAPIIAVAVGGFIFWAVVSFAPLFWSDVAILLRENLGIGATIFNAILIFGFAGSIMISATTVSNSARMEYLLVTPIRMRTVFLEKTIIIIVYNSLLWLVIGTPIFLGLSVVSSAPFAFLSAPTFVILILILITIGVSLGGLLGLLFSKLLAGRRTLKQIGYFFLSSLAIVFSVFWYYSIYFSDENSLIFDSILQIASALGLSSHISPGYTVSAISIGLLVDAPFGLPDIIATVLFLIIGVAMVYMNAYVSEIAHYSGWLATGSKRSSNNNVAIEHTSWNPQVIPFFKLNTTTSASIWYNIASIRREGRVLAQYLVGPLRYVIWIILPSIYLLEEIPTLLPFLFVAALVPFATSYGLYFAGYEIVYEGKNLQNLQLASASMVDYIRGKVYSAQPFVLAASIIVSILMLFLSLDALTYIPALILGCLVVNLASGAVAANAAAFGGDFKADRRITRQRGGNVQMPIRGWSIIRASLLPTIIGYVGIFAILGVGLIYGPLFSYLALLIFSVICHQIFRSYTNSAGKRLNLVEASDYL